MQPSAGCSSAMFDKDFCTCFADCVCSEFACANRTDTEQKEIADFLLLGQQLVAVLMFARKNVMRSVDLPRRRVKPH